MFVSTRVRMAAAALAAGLAFPALVACSDDGDGRAIEEQPERTRESSTTTSSTEPPNYSMVSLVPVAPGQAPPITRPREPGTASLSGRVIDETGAPVPGAVVRASYYLDPNKPEVLESLTLEDGSFAFTALLGGSWRIRAWQEPELATLEAQSIFLSAGERKAFDLKVKRVPAVEVTSSMAPNPPLVGFESQLAVLVVNQVVNSDGIVNRTRLGGTEVTLLVSGQWTLAPGSSNPLTTDSDGTARWNLICGAEGVQAGQVAAVGGLFPVNLPSCLSPASTTTTTVTTLPPGATTTTTKKKPSPTTTTTRKRGVTTTTGSRRGAE
jgi:hypothetical protein